MESPYYVLLFALILHKKAVHMNIIMWLGFLLSLLLFMYTACWFTFCKVYSESAFVLGKIYNNSVCTRLSFLSPHKSLGKIAKVRSL